MTFNVVDREDRLWTIETLDSESQRVDLNYRVVGFAVRDRLRSAGRAFPIFGEFFLNTAPPEK